MSESSAASAWTEQWRSLAKQFQELANQSMALHASITAFEHDSELAQATTRPELEPIWKTIGRRELARPPRSGPGKRPPLSFVRQAFQAMEPSLWIGAGNPDRLKVGLLGRGPEGGQPVLVSIWGGDKAKAQQFADLADEAQAILDADRPNGVVELPLPSQTHGPGWQRWLFSLLVLGLRTNVQIHASLDPFVDEQQVEEALALISGTAPRSHSWADWSQTEVGSAFGLDSPSSIVGVLHEDICLASKRAAEWLAARVSSAPTALQPGEIVAPRRLQAERLEDCYLSIVSQGSMTVFRARVRGGREWQPASCEHTASVRRVVEQRIVYERIPGESLKKDDPRRFREFFRQVFEVPGDPLKSDRSGYYRAAWVARDGSDSEFEYMGR